jgi:hypothetical protein
LATLGFFAAFSTKRDTHHHHLHQQFVSDEPAECPVSSIVNIESENLRR